jgi:hypothetical protein
MPRVQIHAGRIRSIHIAMDTRVTGVGCIVGDVDWIPPHKRVRRVKISVALLGIVVVLAVMLLVNRTYWGFAVSRRPLTCSAAGLFILAAEFQKFHMAGVDS